MRTGSSRDVQQVEPLLFARDPRQFRQPGYQPSLVSAELPAGRVAASADRIGLSQTLLDEVVVEQPHRHQALLQRRVRQAGPGVQHDDIASPAARPRCQLLHERRHVQTLRGNRVDSVSLADQQVLSQSPRVRVDGPGCPPQIRPYSQPLGRPLVPAKDRPLLLQHHRAAQRISSVRGDAAGYELHPAARDCT